jgi:beta-lactam-binding protein with PASTA domain
MTAFDITTKPTTLSLKPGSTGSILVVVSNRLGRPVMGSVEGVLTPAYASSWLLAPPDLLRRYEADPAATMNYEFKVSVPENARAGPVQFKATVRDTLNPDDNRADGQTVAIDVTPSGTSPIAKKKKLPAWVWLIAGVVVLGTGVIIWLTMRPGKVPEVIGMIEEEARDALTDTGFDSVAALDTFEVAGKDTNTVIRQDPVAQSAVPKAREDGKRLATIVVHRPMPLRVPNVVGKNPAEARSALTAAGFAVTAQDTFVRSSDQDISLVVRQVPEAGSALPRDTMVGKTPATIVVKRAATVPNVVGKPPEEARTLLRQAGFAPVHAQDVLTRNARDTNLVTRQSPSAGGPLPRDTMIGVTPATIEVRRLATKVPELLNVGLSTGIKRLKDAGLRVGTVVQKHTVIPMGDRITGVKPAAGTVVRHGSAVDLVVVR